MRKGSRACSAKECFPGLRFASITGLVQVHLTLDRGAGLVLEDRFERGESLARLQATGSTVLGGAPVIVQELFREAAARNVRRLPLRAICLGGTMIPREVLELAVDRHGITPVRVYGSSEVPCATGTLPADEGEARVRDDGACSPGTEVRTDGAVPGELLVRGPMRFLGYLGTRHNDGAFTPGWQGGSCPSRSSCGNRRSPGRRAGRSSGGSSRTAPVRAARCWRRDCVCPRHHGDDPLSDSACGASSAICFKGGRPARRGR